MIFVIDSSDKSSVYNVREELAKVNKDLEYHTVRNYKHLFKHHLAILFYLNKCDLP